MRIRVRVALTLGAFLIAGGALAGTAAAAPSTPPSATPAPSTAATVPQVRPAAPLPDQEAAKRKADAAAKAGVAPRSGKVRVPTAIPAGPVGDLHLPAITASN